MPMPPPADIFLAIAIRSRIPIPAICFIMFAACVKLLTRPETSCTSVPEPRAMRRRRDASIIDGSSGATLWSSSSRGSEAVARVAVEDNAVFGRVPTASVDDVETARARLVRRLADWVTRDFRPRIVKQR